MGWEPIETAPRVHSEAILVFDPFSDDVIRAFWWEGTDSEPGQGWLPDWHGDDEYQKYFIEPTHWMPLPKPPAT